MIGIDLWQGQKVVCGADLEALEAALQDGETFSWVDIRAPSEEDWQTLERLFHFHPLALEDARRQDQRAKLEVYEAFLFLSLRIWVGSDDFTDALPEVTDEIDLFLGANYLVTIHQRDTLPLMEMRKRWEERHDLPLQTPAFLLYMALDIVVDTFYPALDVLNNELDALETLVYSDNTEVDIKPALVLKRRLTLLRQTVVPTRDVINHLLRMEHALLPISLRVYFQDIYDHTLHLVEQVDLHRDILSGAMDAIVAQTSNRLNQIMKTMTGVSTILMTGALIAGIYGMNFKFMPELQQPYGYYGALGAMAFIAIGLSVFFKRIKWF